jgi:hypothetical protein
MTVEITRADLLADLMETFSRSGCPATPTAATRCHVRHPAASSDREAWLEVAFFLRAWQLAHPGIAATLTM